MRVLYLGLPLGALYLHAHGVTPDVVAIGHVDAPGMRRVRRRLSTRSLVLGRPDLADATVQRVLQERKPDVLLSFFWPKRIPSRVLAMPGRGAFGTHPSLLPRWRGPDPYFWALDAGDAITGVTLHRLEDEYDTGSIIERREVPIAPTWNAWTLARALDRPALALLLDAARRLERGEALEGTPQPRAGVTSAPTPRDEDLAIDWHADAASIVRRVRASAPYPGASAELDDTYVEIVRAEVLAESPPAALDVAEAFRTSDGRVAVRAGRGAVVLTRVRNDEGNVVDPAELLGLAGPGDQAS